MRDLQIGLQNDVGPAAVAQDDPAGHAHKIPQIGGQGQLYAATAFARGAYLAHAQIHSGIVLLFLAEGLADRS